MANSNGFVNTVLNAYNGHHHLVIRYMINDVLLV